ncbi:NCS1 family nucleobase:cation symporter-1 [Crenobacter cavernae]|uniref:NCS1 family nucleobase:cation symporter-1 n=1 Tax=Crenobacter cavernae TaxID=2290923 RepID=A0ABY0FA26_9NEIS|nr:NCS1 family nucleobase:cation symporter-1 [Crenobacter cavernae]RXZ42515.1 NCS1 family nucleobase:cation symporter-1 [Crenobacter cavernae]
MNQHPNHGTQAVPPGYSERLYNEDLAPLKDKNWNWYNIFAFWMSDVHSVGGYVFAGSLFALGLASWQVLVCLLVGIGIVQYMSNLVAQPSQQAGIPYPVVCRLSFGVFGANIPAVIRGLIAVAWYGIQTYLASSALVIVVLRFFPELAYLTEIKFAGLSAIGWGGFMAMWLIQAAVFWHGMEAIKKFIDWAGPLVYLVMFLLMAWIVYKAGWNNISFSLSEKSLTGFDAVWQMVIAVVLVVSYFSGPTLNFGDFTRYAKSMDDVKKGNFWGLPVNFLLFSIVTVIVISGTLPVFGKILHDPIETVGLIDNTTVAVLGAFTFITATIGINIVANFVSPAFDFANVNPQKISWRMGGMIAAVGSIFITPWNLFNSPEVIHYTLDSLAAFIGPLYGILLVDYYVVQKKHIDVDALYSDKPGNTYWYENGYNKAAIKALVPAAILALICSHVPGIKEYLGHFSLFVGGFAAAYLYKSLARCPAVVAARLAAARS